MRIMLLVISNGLVIGGAGILAIAQMPIQRLISTLPAGILKQCWCVVRVLICFFIIGYMAFATHSWDVSSGIAALTVPVVFFSGAVVVLMVCLFAFYTSLEVKRRAKRDGDSMCFRLTGTYSRRYFDCCMASELDRAHRYWLPLSIMIVDIDHLKKVSDTYGHRAWKLVLGRIGRLLVQQVRTTDIVARYGDDSFVIITPHTRLPDAHDLAERLRLKVNSTPILLTDIGGKGNGLSMTVSIGVAALFEGIGNGDALIHLAKDALNMAKRFGCNQVVACDQVMGKAGVHIQVN